MRALVLAFLGLSCAHLPKPGDACQETDAFCASPQSALSCREGRLVAFECPGPRGCQVDGDRRVLCEQVAPILSDGPCLPAYEGQAQCAALPGAYLRCDKGQWLHFDCPQGHKCQAQDGGVFCE